MAPILALLFSLLPPLAFADGAPPAPPEASKPQLSCPCDGAYWVPLTEKAKAAQEYWEARRHYKSARAVAGMFGLFAYLAHDARTFNEAQNTLSEAAAKLDAARSHAESLGAVHVVDDLEGPIEFKLIEGKDYTVTPPQKA